MNTRVSPAKGLYSRLESVGASISDNGTVRQSAANILSSPKVKDDLERFAQIKVKPRTESEAA